MKLRSVFTVLAVLFICSGCAHGGGQGTGGVDPTKDHRLRNTLLAVGTVVVIGALVAGQAAGNTRDAIRGGFPQ